jgi:hypothetical protein
MPRPFRRLRALRDRIRLRGLFPGTRIQRRDDPTHGVFSGMEDGLAVCTFAGERLKLPLSEIQLVREGRAR